MPGLRIQLPQGALNLLILKTLALSPQRGWAICGRVQQVPDGALQLRHGSFHPALHRLERLGWFRPIWAAKDIAAVNWVSGHA